MHPADLADRGLVAGDIARVTGHRGELLVAVEASADLVRGQVFLPMHWGGRSLRGAGVNTLTSGAFDPLSKQPELKLAAVEVAKVELPYGLVAFARLDAGLGPFAALQRLLDEFTYATLALFGREAAFVELVARDRAPPPAVTLEALDAALGFGDGVRELRYADPARGVAKRVRFVDGRLAAARLAGETRAAAWLRDAMLEGASDPAARRLAAAPIERLPAAGAPRGRIVCDCHDVAEDAIRELAQSRSLAEIQARLKCGTQCGSCLPELQRLVAAAGPARAAQR
jgi:assimilatory nitrate reductase catalytic subunit